MEPDSRGRPASGTEEVSASRGKPNTRLDIFSPAPGRCPGARGVRRYWETAAEFACPARDHSGESLIGFPPPKTIPYGRRLRIAHEPHPAGEAAARPRGPGCLEGICPPLRAANPPVVPAVETARGRRPGRHPDRPARPGREDARVRLRPGGQFPGLAADGDAQRLEEALVPPAARRGGQRRLGDRRPAPAGNGAR